MQVVHYIQYGGESSGVRFFDDRRQEVKVFFDDRPIDISVAEVVATCTQVFDNQRNGGIKVLMLVRTSYRTRDFDRESKTIDSFGTPTPGRDWIYPECAGTSVAFSPELKFVTGTTPNEIGQGISLWNGESAVVRADLLECLTS